MLPHSSLNNALKSLKKNPSKSNEDLRNLEDLEKEYDEQFNLPNPDSEINFKWKSTKGNKIEIPHLKEVETDEEEIDLK